MLCSCETVNFKSSKRAESCICLKFPGYLPSPDPAKVLGEIQCIIVEITSRNPFLTNDKQSSWINFGWNIDYDGTALKVPGVQV